MKYLESFHPLPQGEGYLEIDSRQFVDILLSQKDVLHNKEFNFIENFIEKKFPLYQKIIKKHNVNGMLIQIDFKPNHPSVYEIRVYKIIDDYFLVDFVDYFNESKSSSYRIDSQRYFKCDQLYGVESFFNNNLKSIF